MTTDTTEDLCNVELRHAAHPETFGIPSRAERESIPRGDFAKVILDDERFWVEVTERHPDGRYTGTVANELVCCDLPYGSPLDFGPEHVADIMHMEELPFCTPDDAERESLALRAYRVTAYSGTPGLKETIQALVQETRDTTATIAVPEYYQSGKTIRAIGAEVTEADDPPGGVVLDVIAYLHQRGPKRGIVLRLQLDPEEAEVLASDLMEAASRISALGGE